MAPLKTIARNVLGDSSLWWRIAEATAWPSRATASCGQARP